MQGLQVVVRNAEVISNCGGTNCIDHAIGPKLQSGGSAQLARRDI
jgi:hypothetical protein